MTKLPPIEKIPEAYTAIVDNRVELFSDYALVKSSNQQKEYLIKRKDNVYYSNDSSTYWQGYPGYPVIAVLMLQKKIKVNERLFKYFKGINWNQLNKENKRNYHLSLEQVLDKLSKDERKMIKEELEKTLTEISQVNIQITKKKSEVC